VLLTNRSREEQAIRRTKLGTRHHALVDGELVAQRQVLNGELAMAAEEEGQETKQVKQQGDHRAGILSGLGLRDQPLALRPTFGEGHAGLGNPNFESMRRP
jgi:hypothetical protein